MHFNLMSLHLGDVLMAMPAMLPGDTVTVRDRFKVPYLNVNWETKGGAHPRNLGTVHQTQAWLSLSNREPVRHKLLPEVARSELVIAPSVMSSTKQWSKWDKLIEMLPYARVIDEKLNRIEWMEALNGAHTVVCPDTGTAHMADALGVPKVIVLHGLGQKHFERYAPFWNRNYCIVRDSMEAITVDDIMGLING